VLAARAPALGGGALVSTLLVLGPGHGAALALFAHGAGVALSTLG